MVDQDVIQTFAQLRDKVVLARSANQRNNEVLADAERSVLHKKLVLAEMSQLPPDVVTYKNVGKAYLFTPKSAIMSQYEDAFKADEAQIAKARADRDTLRKQIESSELELREHLQANPALVAQVVES